MQVNLLEILKFCFIDYHSSIEDNFSKSLLIIRLGNRGKIIFCVKFK